MFKASNTNWISELFDSNGEFIEKSEKLKSFLQSGVCWSNSFIILAVSSDETVKLTLFCKSLVWFTGILLIGLFFEIFLNIPKCSLINSEVVLFFTFVTISIGPVSIVTVSTEEGVENKFWFNNLKLAVNPNPVPPINPVLLTYFWFC